MQRRGYRAEPVGNVWDTEERAGGFMVCLSQALKGKQELSGQTGGKSTLAGVEAGCTRAHSRGRSGHEQHEGLHLRGQRTSRR